MEFTKELIEQFYDNHTLQEFCDEFNLSYYKAKKLFAQFNIEVRKENGFKLKKDKEYELLKSKFSKDSLLEFYATNTNSMAAEKLCVSEGMFKKLLDDFGIEHHSPLEATKISYTNLYGSYEAGKIIEREKAVANTDQISRQKKVSETNRVKYGGDSPFSSKEVRDKAKSTFMDRYGVENAFQIPQVIENNKQNQLSNYGGIGFASEILMDKYKQTMLRDYGVEYGCLTDNCKHANHSKNSKPNLEFCRLLENNNIKYDKREFTVGNFNYDFKIGNILIEVNPSYTHNSTIPYRNTNKILDKNYHISKYLAAKQAGYRCICIWDWDDENKVVQLLNTKEKIYARDCTIKLVPKQDAKDFINKYHLQGYSKASINLGLYYNDELVSIMTFDKPRYNKKFEYELIRYCSSKIVIGGSKKLFKHFLDNYSPESIISYCDNSKFDGKTYLELGFKLNPKKIYPSKHWYNIKTKQHITDNLLRQRGFDQLFGTNYGKGTSNEALMLNAGFVEIYDCGQTTYEYFK